MKKFIGAMFLALVLSVSALAQYPDSPNTGKATTPYATGAFSITFNGPVSVSSPERDSDTATDVRYTSNNGTVWQSVTVRTVDHAIPVDYSSSDFYVNNMTGCDSKESITQGTWDNRPYTYVFCRMTVQGQAVTLRVRFIIVNSNTVLFVKQLALENDNNRDQWLDFEYSLRIR